MQSTKAEKFVKAEKVMQEAYELIASKQKSKFGIYHKCLFHLHTPASHDYVLFKDEGEKEKDFDKGNYYRSLTDEDLIKIITNRKIYSCNFYDKYIETFFRTEGFANLKEFLTYILIAYELIESKIELIVISDHNTISGYKKLVNAVKIYTKDKAYSVYPNVILGIEISCSDKNHIVGIFDNVKKSNTIDNISHFIEEFIMDEQTGTYLNSMQVLEQINSFNGIGYIAHINSSNVFNDKFLTKLYKKKLFDSNLFNVIGVHDAEHEPSARNRLKNFTSKEFCFVLDSDCHEIDTIKDRTFWMKGQSCNFNMIKNAIRDYNIAIEFNKPSPPDIYIRGLVVETGENGFLSDTKNSKDSFCVVFSESLNCFIGGRGTGKSTVLNILDFAIGLNCKDINVLEQICNHDRAWILCSVHNHEYMISLTSPEIRSKDTNLLMHFDEIHGVYDEYTNCYTDFRGREINRNYRFDIEKIALSTLKNYLHVYEIKYIKGQLNKNEIINKRKVLNSILSRGYSINELVRIASSDTIVTYINDLIFKNEKLVSHELTNKITSIKELKNLVSSITERINTRKKEVEKTILEYNSIQDNKLKIVYSVNTSGKEDVNFKYLFNGNNQNYYNNFNITLEGINDYFNSFSCKYGIVKLLDLLINKYYQKINSMLPITDFCEEYTKELIDSGINELSPKDDNAFIESLGITMICKKNIKHIKNIIQQYLLSIENFNLEFNVNNNEQNREVAPQFKKVQSLSLGQKVVAMLSFVISYSEFSNDYTPLIIDQPEDNLDNQYIYRNLVDDLRRVKTKRQVIIATHNATIVTNAKAEQVIIMNSDNKHGWIENTGYPTEKKIINAIISYLEGGKDSFNHKKFLYDDNL